MNNEFTQSIRDLKQAEQNFKYADAEFVDIATIQLLAAKMKVDILLIQRKQRGMLFSKYSRGETLAELTDRIE